MIGSMNLNSPLFDSIRVKREPENEARPQERGCDHPGCKARGEFRAPKGRSREGEFFLFCLEHVKAYNASYNYFNGMTDDAVAAFQKDAAIGHRPTWTLGANARNARAAERGAARTRRAAGKPDAPAADDVFGLFESRFRQQQQRKAEDEKAKLTEPTRKSLDALDLPHDAAKDAIKARYKELVKRFHPDANGGDRSREARLTEIVNAYNHLKRAGRA
jgi:DnaJ-domain-containing protein 1